MKKILIITSALVLSLSMSCQKDAASKKSTLSQANVAATAKPLSTDATTTFAYGSDVSWVTQMEASNTSFYNSSGTKEDLFAILEGLGINAIRLRVWVNPTSGWCNITDVVAKAKRAAADGMSILIDFHYSDTWADPGDQVKPAAWTSLSTSALITEVNTYTTSALNTLKSNGITPTWVQVGNETSNGMLFNDGEASLSTTNFTNFANMVLNGYNAVKAVFPSAKVIVHIANGYDDTTAEWIFDGLKKYGAKWDVCGFSLYPTTSNWSTYNTECLATMNDMVSRYGKQVMICEAGMSVSAASTCESFLSDLITKTKSVSGSNGLGVFYWEPESYNSWQGYTMGAFGTNGEPTVAMNAFAH